MNEKLKMKNEELISLCAFVGISCDFVVKIFLLQGT